jgi:hypothetical protein
LEFRSQVPIVRLGDRGEDCAADVAFAEVLFVHEDLTLTFIKQPSSHNPSERT